VPQDVELGATDVERLLLEGVGAFARDEEPDEVSGRPDREFAELERVGRPVGERMLPGQVQQDAGAIPKPQLRKGALDDRLAQSFLRR
jgi:hypothetical protein